MSETMSSAILRSLWTGVAQSLANFRRMRCAWIHRRSLRRFQLLTRSVAATTVETVVNAAKTTTSFLISILISIFSFVVFNFLALNFCNCSKLSRLLAQLLLIHRPLIDRNSPVTEERHSCTDERVSWCLRTCFKSFNPSH